MAAQDLRAGLVVFLVALPLCLGIALASNAPLISGLIAGIVGGLIVGTLSGSHTSVSGPAAGLTAVVIAQIDALGSFQAFLAAVVLAGLLQLALGFARAGSLARFFPSSVIKGLLSAIGLILILKQIPHLLGLDDDPEGSLAYVQPDEETTFSALGDLASAFHPGAATVGLLSLGLLILWDRTQRLKDSLLPAPLVAVLFGAGLAELFRRMGAPWHVQESHLVQVPVAEDLSGLAAFLQYPDFTQWTSPTLYIAAVTIALVASLETLLNLEAIDGIDPQRRHSPGNRELFAQGAGNIVSGFLGGLPVTSVIVRSSVNINAGVQTKASTLFHGFLLTVGVMFLPGWINRIPLASLAAILLVTGFKLANPDIVRRMHAAGRYQLLPYLGTVAAIVLTDLLIGVLIGLVIKIGFVLLSNFRRPLRRIVERHLGGDVVRIELADQVSFLNRASLQSELNAIPRGGHVLLDARTTDYIDPDVLDMIRDFEKHVGPARNVQVSLLGFQQRYPNLEDRTQYVDYSTRELQSAVTPGQVLQILKDGHERFRTGKRLSRDLARQVAATAGGQHPLAVVLSCIDSRTPAELIFDLGVGDIFSVRVAGNVIGRHSLGSIEYGACVAGAKLILVVGHTRCGAVTTAVELHANGSRAADVTGCTHIGYVVHDIQRSIDAEEFRDLDQLAPEERDQTVNRVARKNVLATVRSIRERSSAIDARIEAGQVAIVGALYDVKTGDLELFVNAAEGEIGSPAASDSPPQVVARK